MRKNMQEKKEWKIFYLGHSAFLIECPSCTMVFDYSEDYLVGDMPIWDHKKPLYVFVSHKHQDHYSRKIFEWAKEMESVTYLLSNDIRMSTTYMQKIGISQTAGRHIYFLGRRKKYRVQKEIVLQIEDDTEIQLKPPYEQKEELISDKPVFEFETFLSTDAGTAFLIEIDKKRIYHAGDLNWWTWKNQTKQEKEQIFSRYKEEIERIGKRKIDLAFLPLDPRQENDFFLGMDYFIKNTDTKMAFPMHCWNDYSVIQKLKEMEESSSYRDRIIEVSDKQREFYI